VHLLERGRTKTFVDSVEKRTQYLEHKKKVLNSIGLFCYKKLLLKAHPEHWQCIAQYKCNNKNKKINNIGASYVSLKKTSNIIVALNYG
jgi:hypothetical protein